MEILRNIGNATLQFLVKIMVSIHEYVVYCALYLDVSLFTIYLSIWLFFGLLGVFIYKFFTDGPSNPFGSDLIEKAMFWFFVVLGPVGFIIAIFDVVMYSLTIRKFERASKNLESEDSYLTRASTDSRYDIPDPSESVIDNYRKSGM